MRFFPVYYVLRLYPNTMNTPQSQNLNSFVIWSLCKYGLLTVHLVLLCRVNILNIYSFNTQIMVKIAYFYMFSQSENKSALYFG